MTTEQIKLGADVRGLSEYLLDDYRIAIIGAMGTGKSITLEVLVGIFNTSAGSETVVEQYKDIDLRPQGKELVYPDQLEVKDRHCLVFDYSDSLINLDRYTALRNHNCAAVVTLATDNSLIHKLDQLFKVFNLVIFTSCDADRDNDQRYYNHYIVEKARA